MGSIVLLDEHTINKIAAGEVVDRPASIVKELVENSIDAGATSITVEIKKGGISLIRVTDNGKGFRSDDVEIAFERHATSKIRKEEDLLHITSMGFRGEALASIAAIAKVNLVTKNKDEDIGTKAIVEGGKILSIEPSAAVIGTRIEIRDVFFNVPARFKFLKKDYTEAGYIEDVVIRQALANPGISFKYINNSKTVLQTSGNMDLRSTIYDVFGKNIYDNVIPVDYEMNDIKVTGMLGLPSISRSTRVDQFTYINSRYIKNKTVTTAIERACEQKLAINKYAFCVLNIKIDPSHIDVNVHPSKLEVKFDDESLVFDAVYYAVRSAFEKNNNQMSPFTNIARIKQENEDVLLDNVVKENINLQDTNVNTNNNMQIENKDQIIDQISKDLLNNGVIKQNKPKKFEFVLEDDKKEKYTPDENAQNVNLYNIESIDNLNNNTDNLDQNNVEENDNTNNSNVENVDNSKDISNIDVQNDTQKIDDLTIKKEPLPYKYVGQVFDTYIIIQINEKMYIIDQHAAHERLLYEQIKQAYYSKDRQSQILLMPILVKLTTKEKDTVMDNIEMFDKGGFIIEDFGDNMVKISGVPNIGYDIDFESMFKDTIDELLGAIKTERSEKEFRFIATLACKAAVKGNMKLDQKEQIALIDEMVKLDNPFTCPHGRPTAYEISKYEIERRFLRK